MAAQLIDQSDGEFHGRPYAYMLRPVEIEYGHV